MDQPNFTGDYDVLLDLVKTRVSVRKLKPDPISDEHVTRILEVGRQRPAAGLHRGEGPGRQERAVPRLYRREQRFHLLDGAAAALGLGSQHVTIHIQVPFKRILGVPDLMTFSLIMPIGYPAVPPKEGVRRPLEDMVHHDKFDMSKYLSNKDVIDYLYKLREKTVPVYGHSYAGRPPADKRRADEGS
jgi:nitroreductase